MALFYDQYWKKTAAKWEGTIYDYGKDAAGPNLMEKLAGLFRQDIHVDRRDAVIRYLGESLRGKVIVDLGCAGGYLCSELLKAGAGKVVGIDISPAAIAAADRRFKKLGIPAEKYSFRVCNINDSGFVMPDCAYVISLGLLEYMSPTEIMSLLQKANGRRIFMAYVQLDRWNPAIRVCHYIYRKIKRFPYITTFTQAQMRGIVERSGFTDIMFYHSGINTYISAGPKR